MSEIDKVRNALAEADACRKAAGYAEMAQRKIYAGTKPVVRKGLLGLVCGKPRCPKGHQWFSESEAWAIAEMLGVVAVDRRRQADEIERGALPS